MKDLITLIHLVVHTYRLEATEFFNVLYRDMKQEYNSFEFSCIDLYKDPILNNTACIVQPSEKLAPRVFPLLPSSKEILQFVKKISFSILSS